MLRTKLFQALAGLVVSIAVLSSFIGIGIIRRQVVRQIQNQVGLDLGSAWAIVDSQLRELRLILELVAIKRVVVDAAEHQDWSSEDLRQRLEVIRRHFGLDFLTVVSPEGQVLLRATPPYRIGDWKRHYSIVRQALAGDTASGFMVMSSKDLEAEGDGLMEQAYIPVEWTARARPSPRQVEDRGLVMVAAVPVQRGPQVLAAVYAGVLLNRNNALVDRIVEVIYKNEMYKGSAMGTATMFLHDCRIATTVRLPNGNRAIGTRVSREVAETVLDNGRNWIGPAFVVQQRYFAAYDPIRDVDGRIVGMLYVGRLERPFRDLSRSVVLRYGGVLVLGLGAALLVAFVVAGRLAKPIDELNLATEKLRRGEPWTAIRSRSYCRELEELIAGFNAMGQALEERERSLRQTNAALAELNASYLEMLGFVSHELKSPVSSILNYAFLLRQQKIGPLTPQQEKAVRSIEANSRRMVEMVRHYLNLSRIETGALKPVLTQVRLVPEVLRSILESLETDLQARRMRVELGVPENLTLKADLNMVHEIFENLLHNAMKYGRDEGLIRVTAQPRDGWVEFSVFNEGPGIAPDKLEAVFQKFVRLQTAEAGRAPRGTGLGLFITRHLVEAHGGRIRVESEPGRWANFVFTLPAWTESGA